MRGGRKNWQERRGPEKAIGHLSPSVDSESIGRSMDGLGNAREDRHDPQETQRSVSGAENAP